MKEKIEVLLFISNSDAFICPCCFQVLQYDMWGVTPTDLWDWASLKEKIAKFGLRNSLLLAPMPTASTAQILGNNESIEAYTSNIYVRRVLSGEFQVRIETSLVFVDFLIVFVHIFLPTGCQPPLAS